MKGIYMLLPLLLPIFPLLNGGAFAQTEVGPGRTRNDMVQTRLLLKPDFVNKYLSGVAILTLQPRGYTADSLELDAKGMTIDKVAIVKGNSASDLSYSYDGMVLHIRLDRKYKVGEKYRVSITYTSKPDEFGKRENGKNEVSKGLYFIGSPQTEQGEQLWTQGEPENNSVWFPCIDKPDQKSSEEVYLTVPDRYVTLSNGLLLASTEKGDHLRTDHWKMNLPHAPYLFFIGAGKYAIVKDRYKGKEVSYYVDKEYAPFARRIFGNTPEMIAYFSRLTGMDFPWPKYAQLIGHDYFNGGMENTTAVLLSQSIEQDDRDLAVGSLFWQQLIAHEVVHHWFGDLVTPDSWGQICLSESFANYGEMLWIGYKYGKDAEAETNWREMTRYLSDPADRKRSLVNTGYADKNSLFDNISYSKGGRVLGMLRNEVGDSAFFRSLHVYLKARAFGTADVEDLRKAFETVTGRDLTGFWKQWFYGSGHPRIDISYDYPEGAKKAIVYVKQTAGDSVFTFPLTIDVYQNNNKTRYHVMIGKASDTLYFPVGMKPGLIDVDPCRSLICERTDHKTPDNILYQYDVAGTYYNRREAIDFCAKRQDDSDAVKLLVHALKDNYFGLRDHALSVINKKDPAIFTLIEPKVINLAENDPSAVVRADAIDVLGAHRKKEYRAVFIGALSDSTYLVRGRSLDALAGIDTAAAVAAALKLADDDPRSRMTPVILHVLLLSGEKNFDAIVRCFDKMPRSRAKLEFVQSLAALLAKMKGNDQVTEGIEAIVHFRESQPFYAYNEVAGYINDKVLEKLALQKTTDGMEAQAAYIRSKIK